MASWMIHFLVADGIMDAIKDLDTEKFIVGNIAPDCGKLCEDGKAYEPDKHITHWQNPQNRNESLKDNFFLKYISGKDMSSDISFYLGYYVHLYTDILWKKHIYRPTKEKYLNRLVNVDELNRKIKEDWYDIDHLFLRENPDFRIFRLFEKIKSFPNTYLAYYSYDVFENKIKEISIFYNTFNGNLDREYTYFDKAMADDFVKTAVKEIKGDLILKNII